MITTVCGLLSGLFCIIADIEAGLASNLAAQLPHPVIGEILCNRTLVGFAIGMSGLALYHWSIHGMVMGFLFSLPLAFSCLMTPQYPIKLFVLTLLFGMIYGLFIETVTSVVFKAPQSWIAKET